MGDRSASVRIRVIVLAVFVALLVGWLAVGYRISLEDQGYFISYSSRLLNYYQRYHVG